MVPNEKMNFVREIEAGKMLRETCDKMGIIAHEMSECSTIDDAQVMCKSRPLGVT